jgi:transcriptional regulator GlxA family with amidase domain
MHLMHEDLSITVSDIADAVHLTPRSLSRLFAATLKASPKQVLSQLRLSHAELMLHYTNESIETIAQTCGFVDRYHFSRAFSRKHNMGPATFRRRAARAHEPEKQ